MATAGLVLAAQLKQLLFAVLNDGPAYSALVPWVLDSEHKGVTLWEYAQERQCLQHVQLQARHARPQDMQQCVLQVIAEACTHGTGLSQATCAHAAALLQPCSNRASTEQHTSGKQQQQQQLKRPGAGKLRAADTSSTGSCCSLSQPASHLAKLHGHILSHLAARDLPEQLHQLVLLLTAGPLSRSSSCSPDAAPGKQTSSGKQGAGRQANNRSSPHPSTVAAAVQQQAQAQPAAGEADGLQGVAVVDSPQQLLPCRACAAEYAGKALQCCNKLLSCMPVELQQAMVCSPYLQQFSPALVNILAKALAAGAAATAVPGNAAGVVSASTPWPQQQQGQTAGPDCTPAGAGSASRPGVLGWAAAATPGSGGSAGSGSAWLTDTHRSLPGSSSAKVGGRAPSRTPASARLSGLGLLMPTTPGTGLPSRPASGGQLPAGGKAAKTAAVCNREKSRDLFFTILRRASSRLDTLRQAQQELAAATAAAAGQPPHQAAAAEQEAAVVADMAELLGEVSVAAKQLLLQLAPSNLGYLAELFMACVLQAASTGEPLLEPALAMIAEKDPGRFQKLQQRLADRTGGTAAASAGLASAPGSNSSSKQAARTGPGSAKQQQQQLQQQQQQAAKQTSQQQGWPQPRAASDLQGGSIAPADGSAHVRPRSRPAKQQQQPHILATASGAQHSQTYAAAKGSSGDMPQKRLVPQRHITPQANGSASNSQQQLFSAGEPALRNGHNGAASPVPSAPIGAADSPLTAHCLSPLFAAAGDSPLMAASLLAKAAPGTAKAGAAGSPLINCSSSAQQAVALLTPATAGATEQQPRPPQRKAVPLASFCNSSTTTPAARPPAASTAAVSLQKPGAPGTATGKPGRAAAAAAALSGPHSAPPKLQAASLGGVTAAGAGAAALAQHGPGPARVMLQLMQLLPPGQHVLALLLHAADSSSFNRALLGVMCSRVEKLLHSSPGSFTAASGLGQQAAAMVALGCYCSYLAFAAGAGGPEVTPEAALPGDASGPAAGVERTLLQQQSLLDVATMLKRVLAGAVPAASGTPELQQQQPSGSSELDTAWRLALAVPFAVSCMRLARLNTAAASSPSARAAWSVLQELKRLPALNPATAAFGALPVCIGCCIQGSQAEQAQAAASTVVSGAGAELGSKWEMESSVERVQELSKVMASGSCLVDSSYWAICCPGLQQAVAALNAATAAVADVGSEGPVSLSTGALRAQQQLQGRTPARITARQEVAGAMATPAAAGQAGARGGVDAAAAAGGAPGAGDTAGDPTLSAAGKSQSSARSSPAGANPARYTIPLLLAPRGPPEVPAPPPVMLEALAAVSNPVRQQLQQAFISQYSTDDNPVKMRDVLTVINGILFANSLSKALSQGLPAVLQRHLDLLQQAVQRQLAPGAQAAGEGSSSPLQGQDLARAVHALYTQQLVAALPEALEAAMRAASDHACQAAAAACGALLPADVPPAAAGTAAALVTASCKASCAQRLLQEVPVLVQSTLADATDDLVRLVSRQWAVHSRMTAGVAATGQAAATMATSSSGGSTPRPAMRTDSHSNSATAASTDCKQPTRLQPVRVSEAAAVAPASTETAEAEGSAAVPSQPCQQLPQKSHSAVTAMPAASDVLQLPEARCAANCVSNGAASVAIQLPPNRDSLAELDTVAGVAQLLVAAYPSVVALAATCAAAAEPSEPPAASAAAVINAYMSTACKHVPLDWQTPQYDACVCSLTAAAAAAAQQLVDGVTDGLFEMQAVEQLLVQALHQAQAAGQDHPTADGDAQHCGTGTGSACESQQGAKQASLQPHMQHVLLLLAGAVMHALLCSTRVGAAVWDGGSAVPVEGPMTHGGDARALLHLVQLPAMLMKAARGDVPVWLLRQLRQWMQAATLGFS